MDIRNPFDRAIEARFNTVARQKADDLIGSATGGRWASDVRDCSVFVVDTIDLCWLGAQAVFEKAAKPEMALQIFDRVINLLNGIDVEARAARIKQEAQEYWESQTDSAEGEKLSMAELLRKHASL